MPGKFSVGEAEPPVAVQLTSTQNTNLNSGVDIDKLAKAVRIHETADCTKGYGAMYNNCYGIKNGSIAPCEEEGQNRMCIYKTPEASTEAFKKIWLQGYGDRFPTREDAMAWAGNDRVDAWYNNVQKLYYDTL